MSKLPQIVLSCCELELEVLPIVYEDIEELYCAHNKIKKIIKLPKNLKRLLCYKNKLTSLPKFPEKLKYICFVNNFIQFGIMTIYPWHIELQLNLMRDEIKKINCVKNLVNSF